MQALWRGKRARNLLEVTRQNIVKLQAAVRGAILRAELTTAILAVILLQTHYRAHYARSRYHRLRVGAIFMQATWRMWSQCRRFEFSKSATTSLAAIWRGRRHRRRFLQIRVFVIQMQHLVRTWLSAVRRRRKLRSDAVVLCQYVWRRLVRRRRAAKCREAAVTLEVNSVCK